MTKKKNDVKPVDELLGETEAGKIWKEIKELEVGMFSLPSQKISHYCTPQAVEPSKLYLVYKVSSIVPALESALGNKFNVEMADKFLVVSRKTDIFGNVK